jgi:hypothetical protein
MTKLDELIEDFKKEKEYFEEQGKTHNEQFNMIAKGVAEYVENAVIKKLQALKDLSQLQE